jgi:5-methylcytosine-specific restriction endonuclease McrA
MAQAKGSDKRRRMQAILARDGGDCWLCGAPVDMSLQSTNDRWAPSLDHVVPNAHGGPNSIDNLRLAHRLCNGKRGAPFFHTIVEAKP